MFIAIHHQWKLEQVSLIFMLHLLGQLVALRSDFAPIQVASFL